MITRRNILAGGLAVPLFPRAFAQVELPWHTRLVRAARQQIGVTRTYDPAYTQLAYPMGDVARSRGVCTDVIIRAYRDAFGMDFQALVHDDMTAAFSAYPKIWGLTRTDRNIDHRRVPNLERFLERSGAAKPLPAHRNDWQPGDIHTMRLDGRLPHISIVSDRRSAQGHPLVIHNIGAGTQEEDLLGQFPQERRFRFPARS